MAMCRHFVLMVLLLLAANMAAAATFTCTSGDAVFTPAANDTVIATESCASVTVECNSNQSCKGTSIYAAPSNFVQINCTELKSCYQANMNIGIPDVPPAGFTQADFDSKVQSFYLSCGDGNSACEGIILKTFEDIVDQTISCAGSLLKSCRNVDAELFNSNPDGSITLICGDTSDGQCDGSNWTVETAGADYTCNGTSCSAATVVTDDPDGDGVSSSYEIQNGTDPNNGNESTTKESELLLSPTTAAIGCGVTKNFSLTNVSGASRTVSLIELVSASGGSEFSISNDSCTGVLADAAVCSISVQASCVAGNGNPSAVLKVFEEGNTSPTIQAAIFASESAVEEARRRIPPVLSSISLSPAATVNAGVAEVNVGTSYTLNFDILGYHSDYDAWAVLFQCTPGDTTCGSSFANGYYYVSAALAGSSSAAPWAYSTLAGDVINAKYFSYNDAICIDQAGEYVLRLYRRSAEDALLGNGSLSLLIPGNAGLPSYSVDKTGRRISFTAVGTGTCP